MVSNICRILLVASLFTPTMAYTQKKAPPGKKDSSTETSTTTSPTTTTTTTSTTTTTTTSPTTTTTTTSTGTTGVTGTWPFVQTPTCGSGAYTRLVNVSTATQLTSALTNARPGDKIQLADGTYNGRFRANVSGTSSSPILLCGSRNAVITAGALSNTGYALIITGSYWVLDGFTITNSQQGMRMLGSRGSVIRRLWVYNIGQEAINLKGFSAHNVVEENRVHDTGKTGEAYGEAIYVGSYHGVWCTYSNCQPDRSDSNVVRNNITGPNVSAEHIDVKEGSVGNYVYGNQFDNRGRSTHQISWVVVYGDNAVVENNRGSGGAYLHAFAVFKTPGGGGNYNILRNNSGDASGGTGFAFRIGGTEAQTSVIQCGQQVTGAQGGYISYNLPCK